MKIEAHAMIHSTMNNVLCDENNATNTSSDVTGLIIFFDFHFMIMATAWCLVSWQVSLVLRETVRMGESERDNTIIQTFRRKCTEESGASPYSS